MDDDTPELMTESDPPVDRGNMEFPVSFSRFAPMLVGTPDEVWTTHLKRKHGRENHLVGEWRALIDKYRHEPAHPSVLGR